MTSDGSRHSEPDDVELDADLWEAFRHHVRAISPQPPPYAAIAHHMERTHRQRWRSPQTSGRAGFLLAAAAAVLVVMLVGTTTSRPGVLQSATSVAEPGPDPTEVPGSTLAAVPEPVCWLDLATSPPSGSCREGALRIEAQDGSPGAWQGTISGLDLPAGWSAVTYHRRWNRPEPERSQSQGYVVHPGNSEPQSIDFYQTAFDVIRDPESTNGGDCSMWPFSSGTTGTSLIGAVELDDQLNDNLACIYFTPDPSSIDEPLVLTPDHPAQGRSLVVRYDR